MTGMRRVLIYTLALLAIAGTSCRTSEAEYARLSGQCTEVGLKAFQAYESRLKHQYREGFSRADEPQFHFSRKLNTCLMKTGHWSFIPYSTPDPQHWDSDLLNEVIDVYANRTLISGGHHNRYVEGRLTSESIGTNPDDFKEKAVALMAQ
jgi:hypothetical protein